MIEGPRPVKPSKDIELHVSLMKDQADISRVAFSPNDASLPVCVTLHILTGLVGIYRSVYLNSKLCTSSVVITSKSGQKVETYCSKQAVHRGTSDLKSGICALSFLTAS